MHISASAPHSYQGKFDLDWEDDVVTVLTLFLNGEPVFGNVATFPTLGINSIALLKSQQTFQQSFQQSFYSSVGHPVVLETLLKIEKYVEISTKLLNCPPA